jgi:uncharacterized membrane protein
MITITVLLIIWFLISFYKVIYKEDYDNLFYNMGLIVGGSFTIVILLISIAVYLP